VPSGLVFWPCLIVTQSRRLLFIQQRSPSHYHALDHSTGPADLFRAHISAGVLTDRSYGCRIFRMSTRICGRVLEITRSRDPEFSREMGRASRGAIIPRSYV
jgi:hypothetical protein